MKFCLIIFSTIFILTGCGQKLPFECREMFRVYDEYVDSMKQRGAPERVISSLNIQRKNMTSRLKELEKPQQIEFCIESEKFFSKAQR